MQMYIYYKMEVNAYNQNNIRFTSNVANTLVVRRVLCKSNILFLFATV